MSASLFSKDSSPNKSLFSAYQDTVNERIRNYGTAVSIGVFIGAALSAGTILGSLTWYVASKSMLEKMVQPLTSAISYTGLGKVLVQGGSAAGSDDESEGISAPEKGSEGGADSSPAPSLLIIISRRVVQLEERIKRLEDKVID